MAKIPTRQGVVQDSSGHDRVSLVTNLLFFTELIRLRLQVVLQYLSLQLIPIFCPVLYTPEKLMWQVLGT